MQDNIKFAFENTVQIRIIKNIPKTPDHVFSKIFTRKMEYLLKKGKPISNKKIHIKKAVVCAAAAIAAALLMASTVGAVRDFFKNFFMELFKTHTTVQSADYSEAPLSIENIYTIKVPEGFEKIYEDELYDWSPYIGFEYCNDDKYLSFTQYVKSKYDVNVNTENHTLKYIQICGSDGYIIDLGNDEYYISWDNGEYIFDLTGNVGKNQLIIIAESVQKAE